MRICLVYDCLYPYTVGGAERWYRSLAAELVREGHEVTYLTRRQWPEREVPDVPGVRVVAVSREDPLYNEDGRRAIGPPLRFGAGVLRHLLRHRRRYDVVHTANFPYFAMLAAWLALRGTPTRLGVDWHEAWSLRYWTSYLGAVGGRIGHLVQRLCVHASGTAFVFSRHSYDRLVAEGLRDEPILLPGLYDGPTAAPAPGSLAEREPLVVFAGRHIPEKRASLVPAAVAAARERIPGLRGLILGDGPEHELIAAEIERLGLHGVVEAAGFVSAAEVEDALRRASCLLLPSSREGYGMVVIEAAVQGTPSVVVAGEDNAAADLVEEGVNGFVASTADPSAIADAVVRAVQGGAELRGRTRDWFDANARRLSAAASAERIGQEYGAA